VTPEAVEASAEAAADPDAPVLPAALPHPTGQSLPVPPAQAMAPLDTPRVALVN
jgi:hypothetical protein